EREAATLARFRAILEPDLGGLRIRGHGDYNLRQLLYTGNDFVIIGFDGDATRSLAERRIKRSALRDVADLVHSLHFAMKAALLGLYSPQGQAPGAVRPEDRPDVEQWGEAWWSRVAQELTSAYLERTRGIQLLPASSSGRRMLLQAFLLERA